MFPTDLDSFSEKRLRPLLPLRTMRPQKHHYLLVKSIPRMHLPDYKPCRHQEYKEFLTPVESSRPTPAPVLDEIAVSFDEEAIIDHFVITHHIVRTRKKGHIYGHHLRRPFGYRSKRGPTRKYPRTRPHHTDTPHLVFTRSSFLSCLILVIKLWKTIRFPVINYGIIIYSCHKD